MALKSAHELALKTITEVEEILSKNLPDGTPPNDIAYVVTAVSVAILARFMAASVKNGGTTEKTANSGVITHWSKWYQEALQSALGAPAPEAK